MYILELKNRISGFKNSLGCLKSKQDIKVRIGEFKGQSIVSMQTEPQRETKLERKNMSIYTMEYYSAIKRNEIGSFVETWMHLETVIQTEVSQKGKNKYRILTHICGT